MGRTNTHAKREKARGALEIVLAVLLDVPATPLQSQPCQEDLRDLSRHRAHLILNKLSHCISYCVETSTGERESSVRM